MTHYAGAVCCPMFSHGETAIHVRKWDSNFMERVCLQLFCDLNSFAMYRRQCGGFHGRDTTMQGIMLIT